MILENDEEAVPQRQAICGGMEEYTCGAIILAGRGVSELSMNLPSIAAIKARLRRISIAQAETFAARALACKNADEVCELLLPQFFLSTPPYL